MEKQQPGNEPSSRCVHVYVYVCMLACVCVCVGGCICEPQLCCPSA